MISRRSVFQLGAAAFVGPHFMRASLDSELVYRAVAQQHDSNFPTRHGNIGRTGVTPGPRLDLSRPTGVLWEVEANMPSVGLILGGTVVFTMDGRLQAIDLLTGEPVWQRQAAISGFTEPSISDGAMFIPGNVMTAIRVDDGEELWTTPGNGRFHDAVAIDDVVLAKDHPTLMALDATTGEQRWVQQYPGLSNPLAVSNGTLYLTNENGSKLDAINIDTGETSWTFSSERFVSPVAATSRSIVVSDEAALYALDPQSGEVHWQTEVENSQLPPTVSDDSVFIIVKEGLQAFDLESGNPLWTFDHSGYVFNCFIWDDEVYLKSVDELISLNASDGVQSGRTNMGISPTNFSMSNGILVVASSTSVTAFASLGIEQSSVVLLEDVVMRAAPTEIGLEQASYPAGTALTTIDEVEESNGTLWVYVTIGNDSGWIPADAIDPEYLPALENDN